MDLTKKVGKCEQSIWICGGKRKGSRGRWDAKRKDPARTVWNWRPLFWHYVVSCDKLHAILVWQPNAAESCEKMGRPKWESDFGRSTRHRLFMGSNWRAPNKNHSRCSDISGQRWKRIEENMKTNKQTFIHTRLFQAKMFPWSGTKKLQAIFTWQEPRRKEVRWAVKFESRCGSAGCGKRLNEDQAEQKRRCSSTGNVCHSEQNNFSESLARLNSVINSLI